FEEILEDAFAVGTVGHDDDTVFRLVEHNRVMAKAWICGVHPRPEGRFRGRREALIAVWSDRGPAPTGCHEGTKSRNQICSSCLRVFVAVHGTRRQTIETVFSDQRPK